MGKLSEVLRTIGKVLMNFMEIGKSPPPPLNVHGISGSLQMFVNLCDFSGTTLISHTSL